MVLLSATGGVEPDAITCSKGLGGGYPVSAVIFNGNTFPQQKIVMHTYSSHQNDPFASALVKGIVGIITRDKLLEKNIVNGKLLLSKLKRLESKFPEYVKNARGVGMMCGFDIGDDSIEDKAMAQRGFDFCKKALKYNLILQDCNSGRTIRLLPNYYSSEEEIDFLINNLESLFSEEKEKTYV